MTAPGHSSPERHGAADRVPRSHAQTRTTLRATLGFMGAAALSAAWGGERWLALHLFLAGAVMLAISGVTLMLAVTWSAAPAPADRWAAIQRACIALGAIGIGVARVGELSVVASAIAGSVYLAGLVLLAWLLVATARRGTQGRFDVAVAAYLGALAAGVVGVAFGIAMATSSTTTSLRSAHVATNLLGLVGLVVAGTLPFFAATVGRSKMSPRASRGRLAMVLGWQVTMLVVAVVSLAVEAALPAAVGLGGYALGVIVVLTRLPRPTRRQLRWAGPRLIALWAGGLWWSVSVAATAVTARSGLPVFDDHWLAVLVIGGYAQIMWGSLAYLLPMLRGGGHQHLGEGFAATRSWLGLVAVNVAAAAFVGSWPLLATIAIVVWVLDSTWRAASVGTTKAARPAGG